MSNDMAYSTNFPFVHLRAHTEYSITESTLRTSELIAKAKESGQPAVAMTDVDNLFGAIRFYKQAREAGVKPILGVDVQILSNDFLKEVVPSQSTSTEDGALKEEGASGIESTKVHRVLLICKDYEGYKKLMELISKAYLENMLNGVPTIREEWLESVGSSGFICLSGDEKSWLGQTLLSDTPEQAQKIAQHYQKIFNGNYYIELQRRGIPEEGELIYKSVSLSQKMGIPVVATHPMQFAEKTDYIAHEIKVCDKTKQILHDRARERRFTPEQYFYNTNYMGELFKDIPDAVENTYRIAQQCNLSIPLGKSVLPPFPTPEGVSLNEYFREQSKQGLRARLEKLFPKEEERKEKEGAYWERLNQELGIIENMGFDGYFMIVADFIGWAKEHNIPVGPGRGSGAGSLVAYSLKITDLDPLKYNLLFERFLNPERVSMPDFDIDFCKERRELVIDYVTQKYGTQAVAGISNIMTLQAKGAIKAAGRALGIPVPAVERITKLIPMKAGKEVSLQETLELPEYADFQDAYEHQAQTKKIVDYALRLEGLPHSIGQHAAGIVMAPGKISDFSALYIPEGKTVAVTQYDKDDIEKAGLVKFDFLGLKTLTEIDYAIRHIKEDYGLVDFDINTVPMDDAQTLASFQQGDTISVFQFESEGMQKLLKEARPDCFEDLVALNALYRPGPMDLIPDFNNRKHGRESVQYPDERLVPVLAETYGVMVYQEQVMQIAQVIGGYTLGGADLLRRAMGKKKPEEMAKHRQIFVQGAIKNGMPEAAAGKLFDDMEKFAGYGFNKSHAAAYSLLAFQTAYIKQHYPAAFYSSWLTVEGEENADSIPALMEDAKRHGIKILPPDINQSRAVFVPEKNADGSMTHIRFGLGALKGLGSEVVGKIELERKRNGPFVDLIDFCRRMEKSANKKTLEVLIKSGAFDSINPNRAQSLEYFPLITKYLEAVSKAEAKELKAKSAGAMELLSDAGKKARKKKPTVSANDIPIPPMPEVEPFNLLAQSLAEKSALGFFFTSNPYDYYKEQLNGLHGILPLSEVSELEPFGSMHWVAGMIMEVKTINTVRGKMGILKITDGQSVQEVKAFAESFEKMAEKAKPDQFILFSVQAKEDKYSGIGLIAQEAYSVDESKTLMADSVNVAFAPENIEKVKEVLQKHPGEVPVKLWHPSETSYVKADIRQEFKCSASALCIEELGALVGERFAKLKLKKGLPLIARPVRNGYRQKN